MYTAVKNKTFAAINRTVSIRVRPVWSRRIDKFIGLEGERKKSHLKMIALFWKKIYNKRGRFRLSRKIRDKPAFTGCHIFFKAEGK